MLARLFVGFAVVVSVGCSGSDKPQKPGEGINHDDAGLIANLVSEIGDNSNPTALAKLFSSPPSATELKKYPTMSYALDGKPKVEGTTATATVKIKLNAGEKDAGTKEWSFVKEGNDWKVKSAPLP